MIKKNTYWRWIFAGVVSALMSVSAAQAAGVGSAPSAGKPIVVAAADCQAIGARVAAQNGGQLARAKLAVSGGKQVCVIVVLIPGSQGSRPRRQEFTVPAN